MAEAILVSVLGSINNAPRRTRKMVPIECPECGYFRGVRKEDGKTHCQMCGTRIV